MTLTKPAVAVLWLMTAALLMGATCKSPTAGFDYSQLQNRCQGNFHLESGDVIRVYVWNEPNHSRDQVLVRPDGQISLPLVGDVQAAGLTVEELSVAIKKAIQKFVPNSKVDVSLVTARSYQIYVMGEVRRTGVLTGQTQLNVLQALSQAGGLTPFAEKDRIFIIWRNKDGEVRIPFNYDEVLAGKRPQQNITLCRGDTVIVP